ncbi:MAG: peptide-methionine (S)-S-oxide reductase MsrA [Pseudomonadota bacterium]
MFRLMQITRAQVILITLATFAGLISFMVVASAQDDAAETPTPPALSGTTAEAVFAGGCFWCVESDFDKVPGVLETTSGYAGGTLPNPTYKQVTYENTGHYEAVKVVYDPQTVSYSELVEYFWRHIDPTDDGGQFCDRGASYRTAIFAASSDERDIAEASKAAIDASGVLRSPIVTPILDAGQFWDAEGYHQDYYKKNPVRYELYRTGCRRDATVRRVWAGEQDADG